MTTSIVIPAFNGLEFLRQNLPLVSRLGADEIIVVDDASTDGSADLVAQKYPQVKLIRNSINRRFPITVNTGFSHAQGEIIILINQDVKPDKNLIKHVLPHFVDPKIFAVTFNENGRSWAAGGWQNGLLEFTNGKLDNRLHESLWPSGGSAAYRHDTWNHLGGFDPIFTPGYFEDLDLGLRARNAGYKIIWDPKCRVDHLTETAFNKAFSPRRLRYIKERNYLIANWKNLPSGMWTAHTTSLIKRIVKNPGYLVPVLWALLRRVIPRSLDRGMKRQNSDKVRQQKHPDR